MKNSFEEQFPGYEIIPDKTPRWKWPLIWMIVLSALIGVPAYVFFSMSKLQVPVPAMVGMNDFSLNTLKNLGLSQLDKGDLRAAAKSLQDYFQLGGRDAEVMASYASVLQQLGYAGRAKEWAKAAVEADPTSSAARIINETLNEK